MQGHTVIDPIEVVETDATHIADEIVDEVIETYVTPIADEVAETDRTHIVDDVEATVTDDTEVTRPASTEPFVHTDGVPWRTQ